MNKPATSVIITTMNNQNLGQKGEDIAVKHLEKEGYKIRERNFWRRPFGEIDIVAQKKDKIIFVEVKTIEEQDDFSPEDELTPKKYRCLLKMAEIYLKEKKLSQDTPCQIDIIAITIKQTDGYKLLHYKNAVEDNP